MCDGNLEAFTRLSDCLFGVHLFFLFLTWKNTWGLKLMNLLLVLLPSSQHVQTLGFLLEASGLSLSTMFPQCSTFSVLTCLPTLPRDRNQATWTVWGFTSWKKSDRVKGWTSVQASKSPEFPSTEIRKKNLHQRGHYLSRQIIAWNKLMAVSSKISSMQTDISCFQNSYSCTKLQYFNKNWWWRHLNSNIAERFYLLIRFLFYFKYDLKIVNQQQQPTSHTSNKKRRKADEQNVLQWSGAKQ